MRRMIGMPLSLSRELERRPRKGMKIVRFLVIEQQRQVEDS
jgi:hypothetical protein